MQEDALAYWQANPGSAWQWDTKANNADGELQVLDA